MNATEGQTMSDVPSIRPEICLVNFLFTHIYSKILLDSAPYKLSVDGNYKKFFIRTGRKYTLKFENIPSKNSSVFYATTMTNGREEFPDQGQIFPFVDLKDFRKGKN